jgi:7,8-dihydropterin-6-yl-methyl-4-(beta-D-ribofuranosyl)aminobenzene 5'-phosphate synthase
MDRVAQASRRGVMLGGGAGLLLTFAGGQGAARSDLVIPRVDRLTLTILVDSAVFGPFLPDETLSGLRVERSSGGGGARMPRQALMAEFGLSILAESAAGDQTRRILVDLGYSPEVMANNLALLGIDPDRIDAAVLSHGHLDHYGGFSGVFASATQGPRRVPLIVGGEEVFCERVAMIGSPPPLMGALDRSELARAGFDVQIADQPSVVAGQAFTTGLIPLETFERAAIPTRMRPGVGCAASNLSAAKRDSAEILDDGEHELATCYVVSGLGLVVIASCSHRGVLNSVRRAQAISGVTKVHAVVGGFHLVRPRTEDEARRTVDEFVAMDPTWIVPMHCTGEVFVQEALRRMPGKVVRPYVGNRLVFGPG